MAADQSTVTRRVSPHLIMGTEMASFCSEEQFSRAISRLDRLESLWSRFLPDSEISQLNRSGGQPVQVSAETVALLEHAVLAWSATDGAFDPTLLGTLARLGYAESRTNPNNVTVLPDFGGAASPGPAGILINPERDTVALPQNTVIDPGGIGKGLAVDLVTDELTADGAGALIELGGDLRCAGPPPPGGWQIDVFNPDRTTVLHRVALAEGGVASSSTQLRRWTTESGDDAHHIVDPQTHIPSANGVAGCTVIAGTAAWAESFTKVAFARPVPEAIRIYEQRRLAALIIDDDGAEYPTTTWKDFIR